MAERTLTVNGLTKSYAMTGWRLGWLIGPVPIIKLATRMNSQTVSCAANFSMHACIAALNGPQDVIYEMRDAYQSRRDFMVKALNEIEGISCRSIEGTFYLFPSFPGSHKNSLELADALLDKAQIAGTPGIAFGQSGEGHVRFAISTAFHDLERAVERLAKIGGGTQVRTSLWVRPLPWRFRARLRFWRRLPGILAKYSHGRFHSRPWSPGESAQRAAVGGEVGKAGQKDARNDPGDSRCVGLLAA